MYGVPRSSVNADLAELAGGAGPLAQRARSKLADGKPLEALHLLDIALTAEAQNRDALTAKKDALQTLRSEEHTSELQSLMRISYAVFCLKKKSKKQQEYDSKR